MPKDDCVRFGHMLDAAKQAAEFCQGRSRSELDTNSMLSLSLVRLLEIIGEAARAVSADGRAAHSAIPWKKIIGMRDRVVHGYFDRKFASANFLISQTQHAGMSGAGWCHGRQPVGA